jgi:hypothetical protein
MSDLDIERAEARARIVQLIERAEVALTGARSRYEPHSWDRKAAAAAAYLGGTATTAQEAMLQAEADETGETLTDLAQLIAANAGAFEVAAARLTGLRRKAMAGIAAAEDAASAWAEVEALKAALAQGG